MENIISVSSYILPSGEIDTERIEMLSAVHTPVFVETVWTVSAGNQDTMQRMSNLFDLLYSEGREQDMLTVIHILSDVIDFAFPDDIFQLCQHATARQHFLFSFLLDFADCMADFTDQQDEDSEIYP